MSYYIFVYLLSIIFSISGGVILWRQYRNLSGFLFLVSMIATSIWFFVYFLFFSGLYSSEILLILSRFDYAIGVVGVYSFLFFILFFSESEESILRLKEFYIIFLFFLGIILFYTLTGYIVYSLEYIGNNGLSREVTGTLFPVHIALHGIFAILFTFFSFRKLKEQTFLNRIRLKNILLWGFFLILSLLIFQLILPYFGVWILEREIVLFFFFFVVAIIYTIKRYYFPQFGYGVGKIVVYILSLTIGVGLLNLIKWFSFVTLDSSISNFWKLQDVYGIIDSLVIITLFSIISNILSRVFLGDTDLEKLRFHIQRLEKIIPNITNLDELNLFLKKEFSKIFMTSTSYIQLFDSPENIGELGKFLSTDKEKIFINDVVFLEQKCRKYNTEKIISEVSPKYSLIFPLFDNQDNELSGLFIIGFKPFGEFYTVDDIRLLRGFITFLELHIKYLKTYQQIQDFSKNLDKKVDEKTIEYNDLINKQKEFISTISHEIKSPIAGAILQVDSIMDDISDTQISRENIHDELEILNVQLVKVGDLLSKLFSVQYYDTRSVSLFKERIQIQNMLNMELDIYERIHEGVHFTRKIDPKMGFIHIDKIQFQQVLTNLLNNAIKFSQSKIPEIHIEAFVREKNFHFSIEDNGEGFSGIDISTIFEKYAIGSSGSVGLGIGLYLCKRIVEMHNGTISASIGSYLHGARIDIIIPI